MGKERDESFKASKKWMTGKNLDGMLVKEVYLLNVGEGEGNYMKSIRMQVDQ